MSGLEHERRSTKGVETEAQMHFLRRHDGDEMQVIISDQRMPGMSGVEFLSKVKELYPETVRIALSGYSEISTVTDAINKGAIWKYISKPWDDEVLVQDIRAAFRLMRPE
ncbi:MAG TPA: response regulator [Rhodocyclaceae bacterium]|nr:response regulator [Rhodocyclaceae bacterium]